MSLSRTLLDRNSYFACSLDSSHPKLNSTQQIATISTGKFIWQFLPREKESSIMQHRLTSKHMQRFLLSLFTFYLFILFPYIPFRYIPWKWKTSHSIYIIRQLAHGITSAAKVEKYL